MSDPSTTALRAEADSWCKDRANELSAGILAVPGLAAKLPVSRYGVICNKAQEYAVLLKAAHLIPELGATTITVEESMAEALRQVQLLGDWLASANPDAASEGKGGGRHQQADDSAMSLRLVAEIWHLRYQGEKADFPVRGNKFLVWLAKLLARPDHDWTVADLYGDSGGKLKADASLGGEGETDKEGLRAIYDRIEEINTITEGTCGSEQLENEKVELLRRVERHSAKGRMEAPVRKAYNNITTQKRKFLQKLEEPMPLLAAHLKACLVPAANDYTISYRPPARTPRWDIENPSA